MAFPQVDAFLAECEALDRLLAPLPESDFERRTRFEGWTVHDVVAHLHMWNRAAELALRDGAALKAFWARFQAARRAGQSGTAFTDEQLGGVRNRALLAEWRAQYRGMAGRMAPLDPRTRVTWAGPDMSLRSHVTARQMETWAHGQAVWDLLGVERADDDRLRNVAVLGVHTFGWTFANRGLPEPGPPPHVRLIAPSGALWEWNEPSEASRVEGSATEFCQVVAQTRNVADTRLRVVGDVARRWLALAQCFAGPPSDPPAPGTRFREVAP